MRKELGAIRDNAGQSVSASTSDAMDQIAEAIQPVLQEIEDRFSAGRRRAAAQVANLADQALRLGSEGGSRAIDRISEQAKGHSFAIIGVALSVGFLIGIAACRR